jgi:glycosyltransferase involved in cell wall biosynthesis
MGFNVRLIGRCLKDSPAVSVNGVKIRRYRMLFNKGPLFYTFFNIRLFIGLFSRFPSVIWSNDMDTLPACWLAAILLRRPLIFDSHELFSEVPELHGRKKIKRIWIRLEDFLIPRITIGITVCESIANYYRKKYNKKFYVLRNVPYQNQVKMKRSDKTKNFKNRRKHIVYLGVLNMGRGLENMILAMNYLKKIRLHIIGKGDIDDKLTGIVKDEKLSKKIRFHGRLTAEELQGLMPAFDLGLSLEENMGLNYYYALPNKLFAYIQSGIPVLASNFPEMKKIIKTYQIGKTINASKPKELARRIEEMLTDKSTYKLWLGNLKIAAGELCWEKESEKLKLIMKQYL